MFTAQNIGLSLIVIAWLYQYARMRYGRRALRPAFAALYALGAGFLVVGGWSISSLSFAEVANILALIAALGVLLASKSRY